MKTIILEQPGQFRLADTPASADIPPGCAMVKVDRVGVCGTDWSAYRGKQPFFTYPRVLGHELGVTIESLNAPGTNLKPGDHCAVEPYLNCGSCIACAAGKTNCCVNLQVLGVHIDGGMRQRLTVPVNKLHRSAKLSADQLAMVEPLGIGCHAVARAQIKSREWTLIIGAGPIGLSVIPFAVAEGANVIVSDISPQRLAQCRQKMGVEHTIEANDQLPESLRKLTGGELPTLIFDATGNATSMERCFDLAATGGRIVFVGLCEGSITFDDPNFHRKELTLLATRNARGDDFSRIIQLLEQERIDTSSWITHRVRCDDAVDALSVWAAPDSGVLKAIVEF